MSKFLKAAKQQASERGRATGTPEKQGEFERGFAEGVQSAWALLEAEGGTETRAGKRGAMAEKIEKQEIGFADICRLHAAFPCWW